MVRRLDPPAALAWRFQSAGWRGGLLHLFPHPLENFKAAESIH
jgi:hypothetical protein